MNAKTVDEIVMDIEKACVTLMIHEKKTLSQCWKVYADSDL